MVCYMGVKLGLSQWIKNSEWKSRIMGVLSKKFGPKLEKIKRRLQENFYVTSLRPLPLPNLTLVVQIDYDKRWCDAVRERRNTHRDMAGKETT